MNIKPHGGRASRVWGRRSWLIVYRGVRDFRGRWASLLLFMVWYVGGSEFLLLAVGSGGTGVCGCVWKEAGLLGKPDQFQGLIGVVVVRGYFILGGTAAQRSIRE